jgi:hypothetical protein
MSAVRKLAKALAQRSTRGFAAERTEGGGVTASIWIDGARFTGRGWYLDEAEADLVEKLIVWSEDGQD